MKLPKRLLGGLLSAVAVALADAVESVEAVAGFEVEVEGGSRQHISGSEMELVSIIRWSEVKDREETGNVRVERVALLLSTRPNRR